MILNPTLPLELYVSHSDPRRRQPRRGYGVKAADAADRNSGFFNELRVLRAEDARDAAVAWLEEHSFDLDAVELKCIEAGGFRHVYLVMIKPRKCELTFSYSTADVGIEMDCFLHGETVLGHAPTIDEINAAVAAHYEKYPQPPVEVETTSEDPK